MSLVGRFIVLDGIDGSGTTTQAQRLVAALEAAGIPARFSCEPSAGPIGRQIRQLLRGLVDPSHAWDTLALLFAADRLDHVAREIQPALAAGITIVCDRYDLSSLAYQSATAVAPDAGGASEGGTPEGGTPDAGPAELLGWIRALNQRALRPDLTVVLDVDPDVAEARRAARGQPAELFERKDLQRRLARLYAAAERLVPGDRVLHVAADAPLDEVAAQLWAGVSRALVGG